MAKFIRLLFGMWKRNVCAKRLWLKVILIALICYVLLVAILTTLCVFGGYEGLDETVMAITPRFVHIHLQFFYVIELHIIASSRFFGLVRLPLSKEELADEARWKDKLLIKFPRHLDCNIIPVKKFPSPISYVQKPNMSEGEVNQSLFSDGFKVKIGGWSSPSTCSARETVAIIVPYRNRHENLMAFLNYMHRFLQLQRRNYVIIVAEQADKKGFNRAKLMNAVVQELMQDYPNINCFILHDVDKLPLNGMNIYGCGVQPRQIITSLWDNEGKLVTDFYRGFLGGVTAFSKWQLLRMNGGSNDFYGWGGEDDDLAARCGLAGFIPTNESPALGKMLDVAHHDDTQKSSSRFGKLMMSKVIRRMKEDGMKEVRYEKEFTEKRSLYTIYSFSL